MNNKAKTDLHIRNLLKNINPKRKINADKIFESQKKFIVTCTSMIAIKELRETAKKWYAQSKMMELKILAESDYQDHPNLVRSLEKARTDMKMLSERHGLEIESCEMMAEGVKIVVKSK